jgi:hypothetical protein
VQRISHGADYDLPASTHLQQQQQQQ